MTWTCYIGGNVGGAFGDASASFPGGEVSTNGSGFAGGAARSVAIINSPVDGRSTSAICTIGPATSSSGTIGVGPLAGAVVNFNNQWFDTLTARIGYSFAAPWSFYFQGGGAWSHTSTDAHDRNIVTAGAPCPPPAVSSTPKQPKLLSSSV